MLHTKIYIDVKLDNVLDRISLQLRICVHSYRVYIGKYRELAARLGLKLKHEYVTHLGSIAVSELYLNLVCLTFLNC